MENNILQFATAQERAAQKFVNHLLEEVSDDDFCTWLVRAKEELVLQGKKDVADNVIRAGIQSRVDRLKAKLEDIVLQKENK